MAVIYKILKPAEWQDWQASGRFLGAPVDRADGFIHFSSAAQAEETAARHFRDAGDLVLAAVDTEALGEALKWEPSRGGDLFPHLYDSVPLEAVLWHAPLPQGADGTHRFPDGWRERAT